MERIREERNWGVEENEIRKKIREIILAGKTGLRIYLN